MKERSGYPSSLLLGLLIVLLAGCAPIFDQRLTEPPKLSLNEERALGSRVFRVAVQELGGVYSDPDLQDYVTRLGRRIAHQSERPKLNWIFTIADRSLAGLYALPGGRVAITRGLVAELENGDELAALLAHAVAHAVDAPLAGRPTVSMVQSVAELKGVRKLPLKPERADQRLAEQLLSRQYPESEELTADRRARKYLQKANLSVSGLSVLKRWCDRTAGLSTWLKSEKGLTSQHSCSPARLLALPQESLHGGREDSSFQTVSARLKETSLGYDLFAQATRLEANGNRREALTTYLQAAAQAPDEPAILTGLGLAYLRADDLQSARTHLDRAVRLQPEYHRSLMGLGYALLFLDQPGKAMSNLQKSAELYPTTENLYLLAESYRRSNQPDKARKHYQIVVDHDRYGQFGRSASAALKEMKR